MTARESIGYGVKLSRRLRSLMLTVTRANGEDATLALVDQLLRHSSDEDLNHILSKFDDADLLIGKNNPPGGRHVLNCEFFELYDTWGDDYPVRLLLDADKQQIKTHAYLDDLDVGKTFDIPHSNEVDTWDLRVQWKRVAVSGERLINGKVPVRATSERAKNRDVRLLEPNTVVRPLLQPTLGSGGAIFPTPDEHGGKKHRELQSREAKREIDRRVREAVAKTGRPARVIHAAYDNDSSDMPVNNLDQIAVRGKVIFVEERDRYYGGGTAQDYQSEMAIDPTWLDVCVLANDMIETTGDCHHVFLEGIDEDCTLSRQRQDGVKVYRFEMGS